MYVLAPYFNALHIGLKAKKTFARGNLLESYFELDDVEFVLYSLDTFYVEVYISVVNKMKIFDIKAISVDDALDKYYL